MTTVAHYRKPKVWSQLVLAMFVVALLLYITFWSYSGHFISRSIHSPRASFLIPGLILAWLCGFSTSVTIGIKAKQLIVDNGRAVWIDRGRLVFLRSWYVYVPCEEIVELSRGEIPTSTFAKTEAVIIRLRGGEQKEFPTSSLFESRDTIIDKLNTALNLK